MGFLCDARGAFILHLPSSSVHKEVFLYAFRHGDGLGQYNKSFVVVWILRADHISKWVLLLEYFDRGSIWYLGIFYYFYTVYNTLTSGKSGVQWGTLSPRLPEQTAHDELEHA